MNLQFPSNGPAMTPTAVPSNQQVVIPQITIPQPMQAFQMPQAYSPSALPGPQLNKVHGLDGAKQFITQANSMYALFDDDDDVMYVKVTDANNYPVSLKRYRFYEEEEPTPQAPPEYVTKTEFEEFKKTPTETYVTQDQFKELIDSVNSMKEELLNAKQPVRTQNYNVGSSTTSRQSADR